MRAGIAQRNMLLSGVDAAAVTGAAVLVVDAGGSR